MGEYTNHAAPEFDLELTSHDGERYLSVDEVIKWLKWQQELLKPDDPIGVELMHNLIKEMVKVKNKIL